MDKPPFKEKIAVTISIKTCLSPGNSTSSYLLWEVYVKGRSTLTFGNHEKVKATGHINMDKHTWTLHSSKQNRGGPWY